MSRNESNRMKLLALIQLHDLSISDIARVAKVSRPLISRIANGEFDLGIGIWATLEMMLPELISKRRKAFFDVAAVEVEQVQAVVEQLKKVA
jgi:predicted transcriptional regulator